MINFNFKVKTSSNDKLSKSVFNDEIFENSKTLIKSQQDHVNEIMQNTKSPEELVFAPQT